ncbi:protein ORF68 [Cyprinid herpesvirus 2]|nr:protein ORF68 [Cyprinid herpesvirus 2]
MTGRYNLKGEPITRRRRSRRRQEGFDEATARQEREQQQQQQQRQQQQQQQQQRQREREQQRRQQEEASAMAAAEAKAQNGPPAEGDRTYVNSETVGEFLGLDPTLDLDLAKRVGELIKEPGIDKESVSKAFGVIVQTVVPVYKVCTNLIQKLYDVSNTHNDTDHPTFYLDDDQDTVLGLVDLLKKYVDADARGELADGKYITGAKKALNDYKTILDKTKLDMKSLQAELDTYKDASNDARERALMGELESVKKQLETQTQNSIKIAQGYQDLQTGTKAATDSLKDVIDQKSKELHDCQLKLSVANSETNKAKKQAYDYKKSVDELTDKLTTANLNYDKSERERKLTLENTVSTEKQCVTIQENYELLASRYKDLKAQYDECKESTRKYDEAMAQKDLDVKTAASRTESAEKARADALERLAECKKQLDETKKMLENARNTRKSLTADTVNQLKAAEDERKKQLEKIEKLEEELESKTVMLNIVTARAEGISDLTEKLRNTYSEQIKVEKENTAQIVKKAEIELESVREESQRAEDSISATLDSVRKELEENMSAVAKLCLDNSELKLREKSIISGYQARVQQLTEELANNNMRVPEQNFELPHIPTPKYTPFTSDNVAQLQGKVTSLEATLNANADYIKEINVSKAKMAESFRKESASLTAAMFIEKRKNSRLNQKLLVTAAKYTNSVLDLEKKTNSMYTLLENRYKSETESIRNQLTELQKERRQLLESVSEKLPIKKKDFDKLMETIGTQITLKSTEQLELARLTMMHYTAEHTKTVVNFQQAIADIRKATDDALESIRKAYMDGEHKLRMEYLMSLVANGVAVGAIDLTEMVSHMMKLPAFRDMPQAASANELVPYLQSKLAPDKTDFRITLLPPVPELELDKLMFDQRYVNRLLELEVQSGLDAGYQNVFKEATQNLTVQSMSDTPLVRAKMGALLAINEQDADMEIDPTEVAAAAVAEVTASASDVLPNIQTTETASRQLIVDTITGDTTDPYKVIDMRFVNGNFKKTISIPVGYGNRSSDEKWLSDGPFLIAGKDSIHVGNLYTSAYPSTEAYSAGLDLSKTVRYLTAKSVNPDSNVVNLLYKKENREIVMSSLYLTNRVEKDSLGPIPVISEVKDLILNREEVSLPQCGVFCAKVAEMLCKVTGYGFKSMMASRAGYWAFGAFSRIARLLDQNNCGLEYTSEYARGFDMMAVKTMMFYTKELAYMFKDMHKENLHPDLKIVADYDMFSHIFFTKRYFTTTLMSLLTSKLSEDDLFLDSEVIEMLFRVLEDMARLGPNLSETTQMDYMKKLLKIGPCTNLICWILFLYDTGTSMLWMTPPKWRPLIKAIPLRRGTEYQTFTYRLLEGNAKNIDTYIEATIEKRKNRLAEYTMELAEARSIPIPKTSMTKRMCMRVQQITDFVNQRAACQADQKPDKRFDFVFAQSYVQPTAISSVYVKSTSAVTDPEENVEVENSISTYFFNALHKKKQQAMKDVQKKREQTEVTTAAATTSNQPNKNNKQQVAPQMQQVKPQTPKKKEDPYQGAAEAQVDTSTMELVDSQVGAEDLLSTRVASAVPKRVKGQPYPTESQESMDTYDEHALQQELNRQQQQQQQLQQQQQQQQLQQQQRDTFATEKAARELKQLQQAERDRNKAAAATQPRDTAPIIMVTSAGQKTSEDEDISKNAQASLAYSENQIQQMTLESARNFMGFQNNEVFKQFQGAVFSLTSLRSGTRINEGSVVAAVKNYYMSMTQFIVNWTNAVHPSLKTTKTFSTTSKSTSYTEYTVANYSWRLFNKINVFLASGNVCMSKNQALMNAANVSFNVKGMSGVSGAFETFFGQHVQAVDTRSNDYSFNKNLFYNYPGRCVAVRFDDLVPGTAIRGKGHRYIMHALAPRFGNSSQYDIDLHGKVHACMIWECMLECIKHEIASITLVLVGGNLYNNPPKYIIPTQLKALLFALRILGNCLPDDFRIDLCFDIKYHNYVSSFLSEHAGVMPATSVQMVTREFVESALYNNIPGPRGPYDQLRQ